MKKTKKIREKLLVARTTGQTHWPFLAPGGHVGLKDANKFMLGAIVDYQIDSDAAWENARRFAEDELGDPKHLWKVIVEQWSEEQWNRDSTWRMCRLHQRFPAAHRRVRAIGLGIHEHYGGDARRIWTGQPPAEVLCRLSGLGSRGVGEQLSRWLLVR